jgi:hypothetical protein
MPEIPVFASMTTSEDVQAGGAAECSNRFCPLAGGGCSGKLHVRAEIVGLTEPIRRGLRIVRPVLPRDVVEGCRGIIEIVPALAGAN